MNVDREALKKLLDPNLTVQDALHCLFDEGLGGCIDGVYITPPDPAVLTDQDSGDDENFSADNLCGRQLQSHAEIIIPEVINDVITVSTDVNITATNSSGKRSWKKGKFECSMPHMPLENFVDTEIYANMSPNELFELFFDDDVINNLVCESNKYALFKNCPDPKLNADEIRCFFGILILSSYNEMPSKSSYWDSQPDLGNELVMNSMSRSRFNEILRFIHCAGNTAIDNADKMWKIRPLVSKIQSNFLKHFVPEREICYDESMVRYCGRHGCKQFIRGKPVRLGYKIWSLNTPKGYLINFDIYQGKSHNSNENYDDVFGKAAATLVKMIEQLPKKLDYHFYFDNLFSNLDLLKYLTERGFSATGTFRQNRIPSSCPLQKKCEMKHKARGDFDEVISKKAGVGLVTLLDNSAVTVGSNCCGTEPVTQAKRHSRAEKNNITNPRPFLISDYNKHMGGTDRMDENIGYYRINIRNKKFYWPLISWLIDAAINNAWQLKRMSNSSMTQLQFRREIVMAYLKKYGVPRRESGRPSSSLGRVVSSKCLPNSRFDGINHFIKKIPGNKKRRCMGQYCSSIMRTMCAKCDIGLCLDCFETYHTLLND